jgi:membrane associated rhomboid family serine protease
LVAEDDDEDTEFPSEMISKVRMRRDKPLDIPKGMLIHGCDNGYREADDELFFAGQITLKQYKRRRKKVMIVDLIRVQDYEKWVKQYERDNESVEQQPSALECQMENIFLCPNKFAGSDSMLARPLSFFGSAFSHCDWPHFFTNMYSLWSFKDSLIRKLDRKTFARLYLFSHICGKMFTTGFYELGPSGRWRQSHGASAALSGVISFAFVNDFSTSYLTFGGVKINAGLAYIIGQFYTDIAGMLKSKTVWQFGRLWNKNVLRLDEDMDAEDFEER